MFAFLFLFKQVITVMWPVPKVKSVFLWSFIWSLLKQYICRVGRDWLTTKEGGDVVKSWLLAIHWIGKRIEWLMVFHTLGKSEAQISAMKDIRQQVSQWQVFSFATFTASRDLYDESRWLTEILFSLWDFYTFPAGQLNCHMAPFIKLVDQISSNVLPCSTSSPTFMYLTSVWDRNSSTGSGN